MRICNDLSSAATKLAYPVKRGRDHMDHVSLALQAAPLQYFTALMGICEELGSADGSARFAQTALQHIEAAFPGGAAPEQRSQQASRLWAAIFVQRLEADRPQVRHVAQPGACWWQMLHPVMACFGSWNSIASNGH